MEVWRWIAEGLRAVIVNPSIIIGPNAGTEGSGSLFKVIKDGLKFYTGGSMGFVDVQDVARCMIALMNSKISGERFIIYAENRSYKDITAELAGASIGKLPAVDKVSSRAAAIVRQFDNSKI